MDTIISLLISIVIGGVIGWLASIIMKAKKGSLLLYVIIGIVGSALGSWLAGLLHLGGGAVVQFLIGVAGACLLIWLVKLIFKK